MTEPSHHAPRTRPYRRHLPCSSCGVLHGRLDRLRTYISGITALYRCQCGHAWWVVQWGDAPKEREVVHV